VHRRPLAALLLAGIVACRGSGAPTAPGTSAVDIGASIVPYEAIDLGTLSDGRSALATAINDNGQVVGWSDNPPRAFLWENGVMIDLGTLGGAYSRPTDINDAGQIVGQSTTAEGHWHPFLWSDGVMTDLHPGAPNFNPYPSPRVNNSGQVIWSDYPVGVSDTKDLPHPFLWSNGVLTDLLGRAGSALGINDRGQVVGGSTFDRLAYVWDNGTLQFLPSLGGTARAYGINNRGQIRGSSQTASPTIGHAVMWEDGQITDLGALPGDSLSTTGGLTESGLVVGLSFNDVYAGGHPFRWQLGVLLPLSPTYQTDSLFVSLAGVNERGTVAGNRRAGRQAVVIENGVTWVLPGLEGSVGSSASGINARGDVVGFVWMNNFGAERAVLWRQTTQTATAAVLPSP
jgi:probable HAF family extracellular repeat protein